MLPKRAAVITILLVGCLCFVSQAFGQSDSLALASASTTPGGAASLKLSLTSPVGTEPAGIQWAITYAASDIVAIAGTVGPAATAAGKSLSCNGIAGSYLCLLTGINSNPISNGVAAIINVTLSPSVTTSTSISVKSPIGASVAGAVISMKATGGTVTVTQTPPLGVSGLSCNPTSLITQTAATCTVTLNRQAPAATVVSLLDNNTNLVIPASVTVAAGSSSATFTASAGVLTVTQTASLTAKLGSSSQTINVTLTPVRSISSVQCNPTSLTFGSSSTCIVTMNRVAAQSVQLAVSTNNSTALRVPTSVTVPANALSARLSVVAGNVIGQFAVTVGPVKKTVITVTGAQKKPKADTSISSLVCSPAASATTAKAGCANEGATPAQGDNSSRISKQANLLVASTDLTGVRPDALSCLPKTLQAGDRIACQAHLAPASVPEALRLTVASSSGDLQVPTSVTTRPMQSTVSFEGYSSPGSKQQSVVVRAAFGGVTVQDSVIILSSPSPVLTVPGRQIVKTGSTVSFAVSALDPDGVTVPVSVAKLPSGASFDPRSGSFSWIPSKVQAGNYDVAFIAVNAAHLSSTARVPIAVGSGKPVITTLVNGASQSAESSCSPGAIASVLGRWLVQDNSTWSDPTGSSVQLGGTTIKVNGEVARLLYASEIRVDFICPQLAPGTPLRVSTEDSFGNTTEVSATMRENSPGIFTVDGSGQGQGMILFPGNSVVATARNPWLWGDPAQPGDNLAIRVTGVSANAGLSVKLGNVVALAQSIRAVDNRPGMLDVLLTLSPGVPIGDAVPVSVQLVQPSGEVIDSNVVTMAVEEIRP